MEPGQNTAGHGDKERGNKVLRRKVAGIAEPLRSAFHHDVGQRSLPCIPQLNEGIALDEHPNKYPQRREQQNGPEHGIDSADDGINGEHRRHQIVSKDNTVNDPGRNRSRRPVKPKDLGRCNVPGSVDEHCPHQQQQQADEHVVKAVDPLIGVRADHSRHLGAAIPQTDHAGEIVVHGTADDVAHGDSDKRNGAKQDALDRPENRPGTGNVQQVDELILPGFHRYVVHAVLLGVSRRLSVVRAEHFFAEFAIQCTARHQDHKTQNEG